jgi:hypothetical protein
VCEQGACRVECTLGASACGSECTFLALDAANCGACGRTCSPGEFCEQGACRRTEDVWLVQNPIDAEDIAVDASDVFWTDLVDFTVSKMDRNGGTAVRLARGQAEPCRLALDDVYAYWTMSTRTGRTDRPVTSCVPARTDAEPQIIAISSKPEGIVIVGDDMYRFDHGATPAVPKAPKRAAWEHRSAALPALLNPAISEPMVATFSCWIARSTSWRRLDDRAKSHGRRAQHLHVGCTVNDASFLYMISGNSVKELSIYALASPGRISLNESDVRSPQPVIQFLSRKGRVRYLCVRSPAHQQKRLDLIQTRWAWRPLLAPTDGFAHRGAIVDGTLSWINKFPARTKIGHVKVH